MSTFRFKRAALAGAALLFVGCSGREQGDIGEHGLRLHASGRAGEAVECYRRAAEVTPGFRWTYFLAIALEDLGDRDGATEACSRALSWEPHQMAARLRLAGLLMKSGQGRQARDSFEAVLRTQPGNARARFGLGWTMLLAGEQDAAYAQFREATRLTPAYGRAWRMMGELDGWKGDDENAARHMALAARFPYVEPVWDDPAAREIAAHNSGAGPLLAESRKREGDEAIRLAERALVLEPERADVRVRLVELYGAAGRHREAEEQFELAVWLAPNCAEAYKAKGEMLARRRKFSGARRAFEMAAQIQP